MAQDSPAVAFGTQQPDQYFTSGHYVPVKEAQSPLAGFSNLLTLTASIPPTPGSLAGRKRSRGDIFANDEELQPDGSLPTPESESFADHATLQTSLHLVHPHAQGMMDVEDAPPTRSQHTSRPSISSRKSQRVDSTVAQHDELAQLLVPGEMREVTSQPLIDEATRALGISWVRMDSSEALTISQAAYCKFIQNHYSSLKDVGVWFENSALPGYLVVATNAHTGQQEFYLFSHDLLEARLVTRDTEDLLARLQLLPAIEFAAPGGHLRAETAAITNPSNQVDHQDQSKVTEQPTPLLDAPKVVAPHGRSTEPAYRYRELLCTAHEMELD